MTFSLLVVPADIEITPPQGGGFIRGNPLEGVRWTSFPSRHIESGDTVSRGYMDIIEHDFPKPIRQVINTLEQSLAIQDPARYFTSAFLRVDALWTGGVLLRARSNGPGHESRLSSFANHQALVHAFALDAEDHVAFCLAAMPQRSAHAKTAFLSSLPKGLFPKAPEKVIFLE